MTDDPAGYKKPPAAHRFPPGKSGNPRGRPKGVANLSTDLAALLSRTIEVTDAGKRRRVGRQESILLALFSKALRGDVRAAATLLNLAQRLMPPAETVDDHALGASDQHIIEEFLRRHGARSDRLP